MQQKSRVQGDGVANQSLFHLPSTIYHPARRVALIAALALTALVAAPVAQQKPPAAGSSASINIPFEHYTMPNGLQVILAPDRTTPSVAVNLWYHVGSKNEEKGRTGFAHLFEHVM